MLPGTIWPTGIFPILMSLVFVHHQGPPAGIKPTTFLSQDTTATATPQDDPVTYKCVQHGGCDSNLQKFVYPIYNTICDHFTFCRSTNVGNRFKLANLVSRKKSQIKTTPTFSI
jgi:hypothetical protein